jgi:hypothetical protein
MEHKLMTDIERIQSQTENDRRKLEAIVSKSRARLQQINENQRKLLEKEQKIMEVA